MSTEKDVKQPKVLNDEILRIKGIVKDKLVLDNMTGDVTSETETPIYEMSLPEDLTMKTVKSVHKFDRNFNTAVASVVGELSLESFKQNKDLEKTECSIPLEGRSSLHITIPRKQEFSVPKRKDSMDSGESPTKTVVQWCPIKAKVRTSMGGGFKVVKEHLMEQGLEFLSKQK